MHKQQISNTGAVFMSWELIMFEKIKKYGEVPEYLMETILIDMVLATVPRKYASEYLADQIQDMKTQIAEQRAGIA